jgi:hypothetical protein
LQDKLHDYLGIMLAVNNAFSDRSSALLTVQTLSSELASLHSRIEKLEAASLKIFGGDRSRIRKIEELKETIRVTEDAKTCAEREYEQIKVTSSSWFFSEELEILMTYSQSSEISLSICYYLQYVACLLYGQFL